MIPKDDVLIRVIDLDNRLIIMIEVDENVTHEKIRNSIPLAIEWRNRLLEYQGPWINGGINYFLEYINSLHKQKVSYREIAKILNLKIEGYLKEYLKCKEKTIEFEKDLYYSIYSPELDDQYNQSAINHAVDLFTPFRWNDNDIDIWLQSGLDNIQNEKKPFLNETPISRQQIIDTLKQWRNSKKRKMYVNLYEDDGVENT